MAVAARRWLSGLGLGSVGTFDERCVPTTKDRPPRRRARGIHGLDPELFGDALSPDQIFRIFVHPAQTTAIDRASVVAPEDVRLLRRIVRDRHQRNYNAAQTIARWPSVRHGDLVHIFPRRPFAGGSGFEY
jgi:hypothetical protein